MSWSTGLAKESRRKWRFSERILQCLPLLASEVVYGHLAILVLARRIATRDRQDAVLLRADSRKRAYKGPGLTCGSERSIEQLGMLDAELCSSQNPALACYFPEPSSDGCASESNTSGPDLEI
jgi:hypothetical protein